MNSGHGGGGTCVVVGVVPVVLASRGNLTL